MAKYLLTARYGAEGVKGLLEAGGTPRRTNATGTIESLGGTVDCFYYSFGDPGEVNVMVICDFPDAQSAAALNLWINSSGRVIGSVEPLLSVEDIDAIAARKGADSAARN